jgi:hypothetical protein
MRFGRVLLLPAALVAAGCFQGQRVIKVNADGSGTITDTVTLGEQAREMMTAMSDMDKSTPDEKKTKKDAKLKSLAEGMGPGVTVSSFQPSVKNGPETVTYAFKDISKLKVDAMPDMTEGDSSKSESKEPLTFRFEKKSGNAVLTVVGAGPKPGEKKPEPPAAKDAPADDKPDPGMAMMKTMMKGLKTTTVIEVNGKIAKTNAAHVEGSRVTLLDLDFDQIAADEATFKKFAKFGGDDPKNMDPAVLAGLKGIKVQTVPEVSIEFAK